MTDLFVPHIVHKKIINSKPINKSVEYSNDTIIPLFVATEAKKIETKITNAVSTQAKKMPRKNLPTSIDVNEYDIVHIDKIIRETLTSKISTLPELERDLQSTLNVLLKGDKHDIVSTQQQLTILRKRIQDIEKTAELSLYIHRTSDIIEKYKKIVNSNVFRNFVYVNEDHEESTLLKNGLISEYLSIARDYIEIKNYKRSIPELKCPGCGVASMRKSVDEDTSYSCCKCGVEIDVLDNTPSFKDTERVNMSNRYTYSRRGHFVDAMKKYQGKHNTDADIIRSVVNEVKREMEYHKLTHIFPPPKGKIFVTKDHIYTFLSELKLSTHYEDINLLYHIITGRECPDFSDIEEAILDLFEEQESALTEIISQDLRVNSINVYYKLYKILQHYYRDIGGSPYKKTDFFILKTKTKEDEHDEKLRKAWNKLGWGWIDT